MQVRNKFLKVNVDFFFQGYTKLKKKTWANL